MFIGIEGPNGVGKTSVVGALAEAIERRHQSRVLITTEPTDTELGRLLRFAGDSVTGAALALGIAADRLLHVEREIRPAEARGEVVISDRYVPSSLVLQRLDNLPMDWIWAVNELAPPPDLVVYLHALPGTLRARLSDRTVRSRMEEIGSPEQELELYEQAFEFLAKKGWNQTMIESDGATPADVALRVLEHVDGQLKSAYK